MCVYSTKSEPIFKICNQWSSPRATRLCAKHRAFQNGKCGEHNISERLKWQEMSRSVKWTKFCKNYFLGKGFCKTSANLFWRRFGFGFRPQKGVWGMNAGGFRNSFSAGLARTKKLKSYFFFKPINFFVLSSPKNIFPNIMNREHRIFAILFFNIVLNFPYGN